MSAGKSLLLKLMERLGEVAVQERYIPRDADGKRVYGYCYQDGSIHINPTVAVVEVLIHELLHSYYLRENGNPGSESTVARLTERLMNEMTDAEMQAFYAAYERRRGAGA